MAQTEKNNNMMQKYWSLSTMLSQAEYNAVYLNEGETMTECLQRILNGEECVRLEAQNILFL